MQIRMKISTPSRPSESNEERLGLPTVSIPRGTRRALQRKILSRRCVPLPRKLRRHLARSLAGAGLLLTFAQGIDAATITVTTNKPGIKADGKCSLDEAIANANDDAATYPDCSAGSGADIIVLPQSSSIKFTSSDYLTVNSPIVIQGNSSKITAKKSKTTFAFVGVGAGGDLTVQNLTITGFTNGALLNRGGILRITNSTVSGQARGTIYNNHALYIEGSTISGNTGGTGGGVTNHYGSVNIINSTISHNVANNGFGGGIYNRSGTITINNSTISNNATFAPKYYSSFGGGIFNAFGYVGIFDSTVSGNTVIGGAANKSGYHFSGVGGGIENAYATLVIHDSTISGNKAVGGPGGHGVSGAIDNVEGTVSIENSTISGNASIGGGSGGIARGGAIRNTQDMLIVNSTISDNQAIPGKPVKGFVVSGTGGGIYNLHHLTIQNSTVTGNRATYGGGIWNAISLSARLTLERSIVSGNQASKFSEIYSYPSGLYAVITVDDFNLFGTNNDPGVFGFTPGPSDIIPAAGVMIGDILDPLADNGGPTLTHALVPGSPAIDAAPVDADCPAEDQRGAGRPQGAMCDIGAFER